MRISVSAVIAMADNGAMGLKGKLPWPRMPSDLKRFRKLTMNKTVVMGRKTYESITTAIGGELPGRQSIILSNSMADGYLTTGNSVVVRNSYDLWPVLRDLGKRTCVVIGGAKTLLALAPNISDLYLTIIHCSPEADVYFPAIDLWNFKPVAVEKHCGSKPSLFSSVSDKTNNVDPLDFTTVDLVRKNRSTSS